MKPFRALQERFGFTRREIAVLLFLCVTFLAGSGVRWYRQHAALRAGAPVFDYTEVDSEFVERARALLIDTSRTTVQPRAQSRRARSAPPLPGSIDINSATPEQLTALPGIGEEIARRIVEHRTEKGPFESVGDLLDVKGIGPKKLEKIRAFIVVTERR
jgi:competence ComEA-like helix-hairpin-helix protein